MQVFIPLDSKFTSGNPKRQLQNAIVAYHKEIGTLPLLGLENTLDGYGIYRYNSVKMMILIGKGGNMSKNKVLKVVNLVLLVLIINQMVGAFLYWSISPTLFEWGHKQAGILLAVVIVIHLILNWSWVKTNYFKK